jgi:hypothetical protein
MGKVGKSLGSLVGAGDDPKLAVASGNASLENMNTMQQGLSGTDTPLNAIIEGYRRGEDMEGLLNKLGYANQQVAGRDAIATGATTGTQFATGELQNNPLFAPMFGEGGLYLNEMANANRLSRQGFQLTPEDREAYGQVSGDVARLFGQQEQSAAQSLADRGLAASPSGAAGAMFSGIAGNKNEMLAKAQMQIANQRMQNTMQRIQMANQMTGQMQGALQEQYGRQLQGKAAREGQMQAAAGMQMASNKDYNAANLDAAKFEQANKSMNIGDAISAGVLQAAKAAPSAALGAATGGGSFGGLFSGMMGKTPTK